MTAPLPRAALAGARLSGSTFPDFAAPAPACRRVPPPTPGEIAFRALPATHLRLLRDRVSGRITLDETESGLDFRTLSHDLALGQVPPGFELAHVARLDPSGPLVDVTARVLHEVAAVCEAEGWEVPGICAAAFEAYGVPCPVVDLDGAGGW